MILLKSVIGELDDETREDVFRGIRELISSGSYIIQVPANLSYSLRVLADDNSDEAESIFAELYNKRVNMMVKRDIVLIMAKRNADFWISNCVKQYSVLSPWERRALLIASYILEDEGDHWRKPFRYASKDKKVSGDEKIPIDKLVDKLVMDWMSYKKNLGSWSIPI